jgi:hypothetical protein
MSALIGGKQVVTYRLQAFREAMWVVAWTGFAAVALAFGRLEASRSVFESGWVVGIGEAIIAGAFIGMLGAVLTVLVGLAPALIVAFRWSGAALVMPLIVVPIVYSSWHRVSVVEVISAVCIGYWVAAAVILLCFRRTNGPGRCRDCAYLLIDEQSVCSECGLQRLGETPPFPRHWTAVREGMAAELCCSGRAFVVTLVVILIVTCTGFTMRARRTESEVRAIIASDALIGLTLEQAERKLRTNASTRATATYAEFSLSHLGSWLEVPYVAVSLNDGFITEASYEIEDF